MRETLSWLTEHWGSPVQYLLAHGLHSAELRRLALAICGDTIPPAMLDAARASSDAVVSSLPAYVASTTATALPPAERVVYLIRHGEATHNQARWGRNDASVYEMEQYADAPLTPLGQDQARASMSDPAASGLSTVDVVVVSPLRRAIETSYLMVPSENVVRAQRYDVLTIFCLFCSASHLLGMCS